MGDTNFDKLYDMYNLLSNAKDKVSEHTQEYLEAIYATKGNEKEKRLATQIISKFFKHFQTLQARALDAIFDLCEDEQGGIRIPAIKSLPGFCQDNAQLLPKVADILAQLLQLDDLQEYNSACSSLMQVLTINPITTLTCIFNQMKTSDKNIRNKCIKFLTTKVKNMDKSILNEKVQDVLITETKNILKDVTAEEFVELMPFLIATNLSQTFKGQQDLLDIAAYQAEMDKPFDPLDNESNQVDRLITCIKFILPFFSAKVESTKFVSYVCCSVLPEWKKISTLNKGELLQLVILRQLAEMSIHCGKLDDINMCMTNVFTLIEEYMPPPPDDPDVNSMPHLNFSFVECLLFTFHKLGKQDQNFIQIPPRSLKDFRARLTYLSRAVQGCCKALSDTEIKDKGLTDDEIRKRKLSPKLFANINTLIKDLFYQPPKYQCIVILSFKLEEAEVRKSPDKSSVSLKRHTPITYEANGASKQPRSNKPSESVKLYTPPSGKYSNTFQSYSGRYRGKSSRGGTTRGRSSGRNWHK